MKNRVYFSLWLILGLGVMSTSLYGQEAVSVPDKFRKHVQEFQISIQRLNDLQVSIADQTRVFLEDLKTIKAKMEDLPQGSRSRKIEAKRFERVISEYLANKYEQLNEMKQIRDRAIGQLERIVAETDGKVSPAMTYLTEKITEVQKKIVDIESELVNLSVIIRYGGGSEADNELLKRELDLAATSKKRAYEQLNQRLLALQEKAEALSSNSGAAYRNHLQKMLTQLKKGFIWIDTEMVYIEAFATIRQEWVNNEAAVVEVIGLIDKFSNFIHQLNAGMEESKSMLDEMDGLWEISNEGSIMVEEIPSLELFEENLLTTDKDKMNEDKVDAILENARKKHIKERR